MEQLLRLSCLSLLLNTIAAQTTVQPQLIFTLDAFSQQQTCVQSCFTNDLSGCTTDIVGSAIGCAFSSCTLAENRFGALDSCYCRADLQPAAESFLTSCIKESCTVGDTSLIIASAVSMYGGYCTSRGYTAALPATNVAETTSPGSEPTSSHTSGATGSIASTTSDPSDAGDTSAQTSSSSPNTTAYIVVGVVGGLAAIAFVTACIFLRKYKKSKQRQQLVEMGPYLDHPSQYPPSVRPLRSEVSSNRTFERDIYPHESASSLGVPPTYPRHQEQSLVSTRM